MSVWVRFAASKTKLDIKCRNFGIEVASQVTKRFNSSGPRKLGINIKIPNLDRYIDYCSVSLPKIKL